MSRGMKGCYVWCVDEETNAWLREAAGQSFLGVGEGVQAGAEAEEELPFRVLEAEEAAGSDRAVPLYEMAVAAGVFSGEQVVEEPTWVELPEAFRGGEGLFVARVVGESMNRRVPSGSWCLFRARPAGTRAGKVVLVQVGGITDPEWGGRYTLKVYGSEVVRGRDGEERKRVVLRPDSTEGRFGAIALEGDGDEDFQVLAEWVAVIG